MNAWAPPLPPGNGVLTVAGGGSSLARHQLAGEIWAINGTWKWLEQQGIPATFFSVDPMPAIAEMAKGAKRAILATACSPLAFERLRGKVFGFVIGEGGTGTGPTSATAIPTLAVKLGYSKVKFYGCESSFTGQTHVYANHPMPMWLKVATKHGDFYTDPEFVMQAETLAAIIRTFPGIFEDHSGGLLGALCADPEWDAIEVSPALRDALEAAA